MKIKLPADSHKIKGIKDAMRRNGLHSVCEEASCPNLSECFNHGTATFMILGLSAPAAARSVTLPTAVRMHRMPMSRRNSVRPSKIWDCVMW